MNKKIWLNQITICNMSNMSEPRTNEAYEDVVV